MIRPEEMTYINQDGVRWAVRQILVHNIKPGLDHTLLLTMGYHADAEGLLHPSQGRLAELTRVTERAVRISLTSYVAKGIIEITTKQYRRLRFNFYRLMDWEALSPARMGELLTDARGGLNGETQPGAAEFRSYLDDRKSVTRRPEIGDATSGTQRHNDRNRGSGKDSFEDSTEDTTKYTSTTPTALRAVSAEPTPPALVLVAKGPAGSSPRPDDLLMAYNDAVDGTPLISINRTLVKADCLRLAQAIKHPALDGNMEAWRDYCRWAANDRWLRGDREGGYPADLAQLCKVKTINQWASRAKPTIRAPKPW